MSHTTGPWAFSEGDRERRGMSEIIKANDKQFRIGWVLCDHLNNLQRAEDISNARLIAAAPELLAACKSAFLQIMPDVEVESSESRQGTASDLYDLLRNVIAKAESE